MSAHLLAKIVVEFMVVDVVYLALGFMACPF